MKSKLRWGAALAAAATAGWLAAAAWTATAQSKAARFAQLTMEQLDTQQRPIGQRIMGFSSVGIGGPYNLLLRSPQAAVPMLDLLDYLRFHTSVPRRLNEFAIMIQGRLWRSQVEWAAHYPLALKAGVSPAILADLKANRRPGGMSPEEAAVYDFCMELYTRHTVSDTSYQVLHHVLSEQQIVDLTLLNGTYAGVASLMAMAEQGVPAGRPAAFGPTDP